MNPGWAGVLLLGVLLVGCGGGQGKLAKVETPPPAAVAQEPTDLRDLQEDSLTEQLSAQRVEELYAKSGIPGWDPAVEEELRKWDYRLKFDVPIHINKQVKAYLVYFSTERKEVIRRYLARSTRYLPMIRAIFQEHGLPQDLAYLAMIESGFNPHAYSRAHACGMWQFIRSTGRRYGLMINRYVDERRDPEKSTRAAARYLLDLYKQFGSWYLAAASYNCGEHRVQREIDNSNHKNFWELSAHRCLPQETKNYVPQMIAATLIAKNPERFGFKNIPYLPPLQYDKVRVTETTSLAAAAAACNVPLEEIRLLNPELRLGITPPQAGYYTLRIPKGSSDSFRRNIMMARVLHPPKIRPYKRFAKKKYRRRHKRKYASRRVKRRVYRSKRRTRKVARTSRRKVVKTASVRRSKSRRGRPATVLASLWGTPKSSKSGVKRASRKKATRTVWLAGARAKAPRPRPRASPSASGSKPS
ncbi:MAG: lytic transglycosylase domain-containing protein [Deltaproteobacteria bacterium]|nr:lytic transglycosylase domain-containing protein [Deltaproteobacteria bacterium]